MEWHERLENLEIRLASQDDLLDALNQTIYRQQKKSMNLMRYVPRWPGESPKYRHRPAARYRMKSHRITDHE